MSRRKINAPDASQAPARGAPPSKTRVYGQTLLSGCRKMLGDALDFEELGVGVIHSHPQGCAPFPSHSDDDMDSYFAEEFERFGNGRPYASLIVSRDSESTRCEILTRFSS
jgi:hypothetical protein